MGRKLLVALAMEGKFSTEGLQAVGEDDDLLMAMARELVTEKGIGENAELVWRSIQEQNAAFAHAAPAKIEPELEVTLENISLPQPPISAVVDQLVLFGASFNSASVGKHARPRRATNVSRNSRQLVLF